MTFRGVRRALDRAFEPVREGLETFANHSPSQFALAVFAAMILFFSFLFALPIASADGTATDYVDALFTAVTTVCVAGLTTVDMATHWSPLGNAFIVIATQVGALGVLTLASILGLVISGRLGLRTRLMAASDTNPLRLHAGPVSESQAIRLGDIGGLLATVAVSLLAIEAVSCFEAGDQGGTYNGNPLMTAVGVAVLRRLIAPGFMDQVNARGEYLAADQRVGHRGDHAAWA